MKLISSIKSSTFKSTLFRGYRFASIGILMLLFSAVFMPLNDLKIFGPFCVVFSFFLITFGLLPYRRLKKLEICPHEIRISPDEHLLFSIKKRPTFIVALKDIENLFYNDDPYGIAIDLKEDAIIDVVDPRFDIHFFKMNSQKKQGCDLFIPYFSKRAFEELNSIKWDDKTRDIKNDGQT